MYLGGVPEDIAKEAFSKWHLRNITSFKGMIATIHSYDIRILDIPINVTFI